APTLQRTAQVKYGANNTSASVVGTWPDYATVRNSPVELGDYFTDADVTGRKRVAVIGYQVAQDLFGSSQAALGQKVQIAGV
ncbi:ABC transporter permease, partial [Escherichia coli]|nr:ABC transporter permease [Escherichia coli]